MKKQYIVYNNTDSEQYKIIAPCYDFVDEWVVNHLDLSKEWNISNPMNLKQARIIILTSIINIKSILKTREKMKDFIEIIIMISILIIFSAWILILLYFSLGL